MPRVSENYRVVLQDGEGSEITLYVHAPTQDAAETEAKRKHPQATVQSCSPGDPPEGGSLLIFQGAAVPETETENETSTDGRTQESEEIVYIPNPGSAILCPDCGDLIPAPDEGRVWRCREVYGGCGTELEPVSVFRRVDGS